MSKPLGRIPRLTGARWLASQSHQFRLRLRRRREEHLRRSQEERYVPGPFPVVYVLLLAGGLVAASGLYFLFALYLRAVHAPFSNAGSRIELAKVALLTVAGAGAVASLYVAYRKQRSDEAGQLREQDRLFTERFTKAAEHLGHESAAVRLAGVYALARIADDSPRDRDTCMRTLAAYLRMPYDGDDGPDQAPPEGEVRRTALAVIAERLDPHQPEKFWLGADLDLRGAQLDQVDFSGAEIEVASFQGARFRGGAAFVGTSFGKAVDFSWAVFGGAALFDDAVFGSDGSAVTFAQAAFSSSGASFVNASFEGRRADFRRAVFNGDANFDGVTFGGSALFQLARFCRYASFRRGSFHDSLSFHEAVFYGYADFEKSSFSGYVCFEHTHFRGIKTQVNESTTLDDSATFAGACFKGDTLFNAALFDGGGLLAGVDFADANLRLDEACKVIYDGTTRWPKNWPSDFVVPEQWHEGSEDGLFSKPGAAAMFYNYAKPGSDETDTSHLASRDELVLAARSLFESEIKVIGIPPDVNPDGAIRALPSPESIMIKGAIAEKSAGPTDWIELAPRPGKSSTSLGEGTEAGDS